MNFILNLIRAAWWGFLIVMIATGIRLWGEIVVYVVRKRRRQ